MNRAWAMWIMGCAWWPLSAQPQVLSPAVTTKSIAVQRSSIIAGEAELRRLGEQPRVELQRLDAEQRALCQPNPNAAACRNHIDANRVRRAALLKKLEFTQSHVPAQSAAKCNGCHGAPSAAGATDPIRPGLPGASSGGGAGAPSTPAVPQPGGAGKSGPAATQCFIATAAWGSDRAPEVAELRRFRDQVLLAHGAGRVFVDVYQQLSPPLAAFIADRPVLRGVVRASLTPLVWAVRHPQGLLLGGLVALLMTAVLLQAAAKRRRRPRLAGRLAR